MKVIYDQFDQWTRKSYDETVADTECRLQNGFRFNKYH